jgi:hypothetical protein
MLYKFCIKLVQTPHKIFSSKGLMPCKFCIKLVQITYKIFPMVLVVYSFQALKLGSARLYYLIVDFLEMRPDVSNHAANRCIFLNHLNKYGIFLTVLNV